MKLVLVCSHSLRHNYGLYIMLMFVQIWNDSLPRALSWGLCRINILCALITLFPETLYILYPPRAWALFLSFVWSQATEYKEVHRHSSINHKANVLLVDISFGTLSSCLCLQDVPHYLHPFIAIWLGGLCKAITTISHKSPLARLIL